MTTNRSGPATPERLLKHVAQNTAGCWLWTGAVNNKGYGQVGTNGRTRSAHRIAFQLWNGTIPAGLTVDHTCHNADKTCPGGTTCQHRRCINPAHLDVVTRAENRRRRSRAPFWQPAATSP